MRYDRISVLLGGVLLAAGCAEVTTPEGQPVAAAPAGAAAVAAATYPAPPGAGELGSELYAPNATVRVDLRDDTNTLTFHSDGTVDNLVHSNKMVAHGRWWVAANQLCINWSGTNRPECWPYPVAWVPGETMTLTSDRGNSVRATLIAGTP
jgi:hypothetical protein